MLGCKGNGSIRLAAEPLLHVVVAGKESEASPDGQGCHNRIITTSGRGLINAHAVICSRGAEVEPARLQPREVDGHAVEPLIVPHPHGSGKAGAKHGCRIRCPRGVHLKGIVIRANESRRLPLIHPEFQAGVERESVAQNSLVGLLIGWRIGRQLVGRPSPLTLETQ